MSDSRQPGCTVGFSFGVLVIMAMVGLLMLAGAGSGGGGTTDSNNRTETHILSDNRIFSPDTTIIVNSGNGPTISGDRSTVVTSGGETLCADPSAPGQYNSASCRRGQP